MTSNNNSEFVLEEGLDDEEDMLSFSQQQQEQQLHGEAVMDEKLNNESSNLADPSSPMTKSASVREGESSNTQQSPLPSSPQQQAQEEEEVIKAVIIDGLPLTARRKDLDAILEDTRDRISNVRLRRLERHGILRVRVEFSTSESAKESLKYDGSKYPSSSSSTSTEQDIYISVKPASEERWNAIITSTSTSTSTSIPTPIQSHNDLKQTGEMLSKSFWNVFSNAKSVAEKLEHKARELGQRIDNELHVNETVQNINKKLQVSEKVDQLSQAGKQMDEKLGISSSVGSAIENVGGAAKIVAREVDENLRVSDKARDATNMAITSPNAVGKVTRSVLNSIESDKAAGSTPSKKRYHPRKLDFDSAHANGSSGSSSVDPIGIVSMDELDESTDSPSGHNSK